VSLASSLRDVGVSRFTLGDLTVEFAPQYEQVDVAQVEPQEPSPMELAAMKLAGRGRAA
jgi:hypothetical protein